MLDGIFDPVSFGLDHEPLVKTAEITVEPPTLRDNTGLADRSARAAARALGLDEVSFPLGLASDLNQLGRDSEGRFRVSCQVEGRTGKLILLSGVDDLPSGLGLAVDVGSTTLVLALVDLEKPAVIAQTTRPNPQIEFGQDILTRAHFAEKPGGLERLTLCLRRAINEALTDLCRSAGADPARVAAAALAGNTTMTHFFLGLPVRTLIREPYVPVINRPEGLRASDLGLAVAPQAPVLIMPNKGSYFGGDLMAGLVTAGMARSEKLSLLVDVGTNAEVVLGQRDWLLSAAGAAGPALEGGAAARGMAAGPGAIDRVRIDRQTGRISWRTIDAAPPRGICGSGLIDLFAELFLSGLIDFRGKITLPPGDARRVETDEGPAVVVARAEETDSGEPILLSEVELDILTRSKAGMYTILSTVLKSVDLDFDTIEKFFVAGTFGQYIDPRMAVAVGMIPDLPLDRFEPLGNSSLKGAILTLVSGRARAEVLEVWRRLTYLEMNVNQDLMNRFSAARFIPHTDRSLFPSVGTTIK